MTTTERILAGFTARGDDTHLVTPGRDVTLCRRRVSGQTFPFDADACDPNLCPKCWDRYRSNA